MFVIKAYKVRQKWKCKASLVGHQVKSCSIFRCMNLSISYGTYLPSNNLLLPGAKEISVQLVLCSIWKQWIWPICGTSSELFH